MPDEGSEGERAVGRRTLCYARTCTRIVSPRNENEFLVELRDVTVPMRFHLDQIIILPWI